MVRQLREGFAEKLEARGINNVWRQVEGVLTLIWRRVDGVWEPVHEDRYYDRERQTGENND